jgi:hypothetical protein
MSEGRTIYLLKVKIRYKKGRSTVTQDVEVVGMETTVGTIQSSDRMMTHIRGHAFSGMTPKKRDALEVEVVDVVSVKGLSKSFFYMSDDKDNT